MFGHGRVPAAVVKSLSRGRNFLELLYRLACGKVVQKQAQFVHRPVENLLAEKFFWGL